MNTAYRDLFVARVAGAIAASRAASLVTHAGLRGQLREILVRDLFRPLLPADLGIGHGQIAATDGRLSTEQDVVLYDRRILPPLTYEQVHGVFPVEAVLATIEIKSCVTASNLKDASAAAVALHDFPYLPGIKDLATGKHQPHRIEKLIPCLFAMSSDLPGTGKTELQRYLEVAPDSPAGLRALCVVERGYWFRTDTGWYPLQQQYPLSEVVGFLAGLSYAFERIRTSRQRPDLAHYLFPPGSLPLPSPAP